MCQAKSHLRPQPTPRKTNIRKKYVFLLLIFLFTAPLLNSALWAFPLNRKEVLVVLDPGHGGTSTGARGLGGALEKKITLHLAQAIARELQSHCRVLLTREGDFDPGSDRRAELANNRKAHLFISLHTGAGFGQTPGPLRILHMPEPPSSPSPQPETWHQGYISHLAQASLLAQKLAQSLKEASLPRKIHLQTAEISILAPLDMPAVFLEVGHINAPQDALWLSDPATHRQLAQSIALGIRAYLDTTF
jgi:N-acetylmuramoyl-L-alanine amidase